MIEQIRIRDGKFRSNSAEAEVARAKDQPLDPGVDQCPGAHDARFKGYIHRRVFEPVVLSRRAGSSKQQHFGMGGRISEGDWAIVRARDDCAVADKYGADRDFAFRFGQAGFGDGFAHGVDFSQNNRPS